MNLWLIEDIDDLKRPINAFADKERPGKANYLFECLAFLLDVHLIVLLQVLRLVLVIDWLVVFYL